MEKRERFLGSLIGLAVGDCVGAAVEFKPRRSFEPVTDMIGGGPFGLKPGEWTDDTSMALCLAQSLIEKNGFNADDQMQRYVKWYKEGYLSSTGECFDIGIGTAEALHHYLKTGNPYSGSSDPKKAGNGSIMRLASVPLLWSNDLNLAIHFSGESSKTTHRAEETIDACHYLGALIAGAANGISKEKLLSPEFVGLIEEKIGRSLAPKIKEVAEGSYKRKQIQQISSSGYVVHSLEAALWAFYLSDTFKEGLLMVVNLGEDSDTTGAIYGQLAGAFYGVSSIPNNWVQQLAEIVFIKETVQQLFEQHEKISEYAYMGETSEYNIFLNHQDQLYYQIDFNSQVEANIDGEWHNGIFKNSYFETDYKWSVFFSDKKEAILLAEKTQIRIKREYVEKRPEKAPQLLGRLKEYEELIRRNRKNEAKKTLRLSQYE
jgi:ADP-ribosyl-[dinitrogen reductase] hydrolase